MARPTTAWRSSSASLGGTRTSVQSRTTETEASSTPRIEPWNWPLAIFVLLTASDDRLLPRIFEKSMRLLEKYPKAGICSTLSAVMDERGRYQGIAQTPVIARVERFLEPREALATLRKHGSWFMGNTATYRRVALLEIGGFIPELGPYSDGFADMVLAVRYGACFIPEPLALWRKMASSYAHRTSVDVDRVLEITAAAKRLMVSKYSDLFPSDYVDDWERLQLYGVAIGFISTTRQMHLQGLRRLVQHTGSLDAVFFAVLRASMAVEYALVRIYLSARLGRGHTWQAIARKLRYLLDPRLRAQLKPRR